MPTKQETLADFGIRNITQYATEVNLDRAIPELYDGLKPVLRRAAWSAHQFHSGEAVKSAKIVGQCFIVGTKVTLADGSKKNIEDCNIGDIVKTDKSDCKIVKTFENPDCKTMTLVFNDKSEITCTHDHIFYAVLGDTELEKRADELRFGDLLLAEHGLVKRVSGIRYQVEHQTTYCIEVEKRHRFYANGILAHNCIGSYHPHGDSSVYGAMQTMVHHNVPLLAGVGNWGTIIDPAAAYRYCFTSSTRVLTKRGLVTMGELAKLSKVDSDNVEYEIFVDTRSGVEKTSHFVNSGIQEVVKVTTDRGYEVTCTPNEPFYVMRETGYEWVEAQNLKPTDWICLKRGTNLKVKGNHNLPLAYARFLGYMVGDGSINRNQNYIEFNQVDYSVFSDFLDCAYIVLGKYRSKFKVEKCEPRSYGKQPYYDWRLASTEAKRDLAKLGLTEGDSYDRVVPEPVFHGNPKFVAEFLSALFEADGSALECKNSSTTIVLNSVSKKLLTDVDLLLRTYFGIFSTFAYDRLGYRLNITGAQNVSLFKKHIGFRSERKNAKIHVNEDALNGTSNSGTFNDCIPFSNKLGFSDSDRTRRNTFRHKVESGVIKSDIAKIIYDRDYYYCRVVSVKDAGEEQVWDLTVPRTHSFVANGFIVHNTNCLLNKFGNSVFDANYKAVMDTVPNFDNSTTEPVVLPVRLPLLVLNGGEGIGVGITSSIPTFTLDSVVEVLNALFSGKKLTAKDYAKILKPKQHWGGHLVKSEQNKKAWLDLMETGRAQVQFEPTLEIDEAKKTITISEWPAKLDPVKFIQKVKQIPEVQRAQNSKGSTTFTIETKKGYNLTQFQALVAKVRKLSITAESYRLNVTHRISQTVDGVTSYDTKFLALSIPEFFETWCKLRLRLEKRSLTYQMNKQQEAIDYHELLIYAADHLPVIFKALKQKDSRGYLMSNLKLTEKQADQILDLKVRNLSKLDQSQLKSKLKDLKARMKELQGFYKKPKTKIKSEFPQLLSLITEDMKAQSKRDNQELTVK